MVPFRVFDAEKKEMWIVLNYHADQTGGSYLVAREDDSDQDGVMKLVTTKDMTKLRLVDFLDEGEEFRD